jgi:hypothetical protein
MAAGRRAGGPAELLSKVTELVAGSPELSGLVDQVRGRLFEAGRNAAVSVATHQVESLTDRVGKRVGSLGDRARGVASPTEEGEAAEAEPDETAADETAAEETGADQDVADEAGGGPADEEPEQPRPAARARSAPAGRPRAAAAGAARRAGAAARGAAAEKPARRTGRPPARKRTEG